MVSIEDLRKENERLKKIQKGLNGIIKSNQQRRQLLMENKKIARDIKNIKSGKVIRISKSIGKSAGKGLFRAGKGAFRGLQKYANFLQQQEKKQQQLNRKLKSARKASKRK